MRRGGNACTIIAPDVHARILQRQMTQCAHLTPYSKQYTIAGKHRYELFQIHGCECSVAYGYKRSGAVQIDLPGRQSSEHAQ